MAPRRVPLDDRARRPRPHRGAARFGRGRGAGRVLHADRRRRLGADLRLQRPQGRQRPGGARRARGGRRHRSEEHTSELQSLMRISYAVFCLKKKKNMSTTKSNHVQTEKKYYTVKLIEHSQIITSCITPTVTQHS